MDENNATMRDVIDRALVPVLDVVESLSASITHAREARHALEDRLLATERRLDAAEKTIELLRRHKADAL
jgi:hypothetical protein